MVLVKALSVSMEITFWGGVSHEGRSGDGFPKGIVSNGCMTKRHVGLTQSGALGSYGNI